MATAKSHASSFIRDTQALIKDIFKVAKYCERRAEIEALRREFTQIKLAQMAPQMATNKRTMIVDKRPQVCGTGKKYLYENIFILIILIFAQEHKYIIAALVNQFIWCNHRVGVIAYFYSN
jgi:hypothetical protein